MRAGGTLQNALNHKTHKYRCSGFDTEVGVAKDAVRELAPGRRLACICGGQHQPALRQVPWKSLCEAGTLENINVTQTPRKTVAA